MKADSVSARSSVRQISEDPHRGLTPEVQNPLAGFVWEKSTTTTANPSVTRETRGMILSYAVALWKTYTRQTRK